MRKIVFAIITISMLSVNAIAADRPQWFYDAIKVENPNQLAYFVEMDKNCPFNKETLNDTVDGVLIRSRIKPLKENIFVPGHIYLSLDVSCLKLKQTNPVFSIQLYFARYKPYPAILIKRGFGSIGIGPSDFILQTFKEKVERAVTEYIKANFNLGSSE